MSEKLLTRDQFRKAVFARDNNVCVFCKDTAIDAHHILERKLFDNGGYYLSNGASVCSKHHLDCEMTIISVEDVRLACNITKPIIPEHLYIDHIYDKWGNVVLPSGKRTKGELFFDESVQKILKAGNVLDLFTNYVKYPRTLHFPFSPGISSDDRVHFNLDFFKDKRVIVTEKMDGENSSLYCDYFHARSLDSKNHESRNWIKKFWSTISHEIPKGWRFCGENMYAEHSLHYSNLESYFYLFSIWNEKNNCLSWDETKEWAELLEMPTVKVLYDSIFDEKQIKNLCISLNSNVIEGAVMRAADGFNYFDFRKCVAKYVRANHVTSDQHWFFGKRMKVNELK